jgi:cyclopropane-fatty-acyl-phospholipid synthase
LSDSHPLDYLWRRIAPWLIGRSTANRQAIATHYEFDNDFYLKFLDATRCYSQAVFEQDEEALETAQLRKLNFAVEACALKPGDRVLDVGGGWGSFTEHAGRRGIEVTVLTISGQSERFLKDLIQRLQLPAGVLNQDFLMYDSPEPYDAIVILGVMEHLPDYPAVLRRLHRLLRAGWTRLSRRQCFPGKVRKAHFRLTLYLPGRPFLLLFARFPCRGGQTPLDVLAVYNDRHSYFLTCRAWAENLEAARDEIVRRWGEALYRRFRLYLWGSAFAFRNRDMEAYRVVLEKPQ